MEQYQGIILIRLQNVGSKSEGRYAYLVRDDDMSTVKLCREGVPPVDDPYFGPFDRQEAVVLKVAGNATNGETDENTQQQ